MTATRDELAQEAAVGGDPMWCDGCRATGAVHCAHPNECGNMLTATRAADQWKSWLDDLPLPYTFDPAIGRLQDFITALTTRFDVPQPALSTDPVVMKLVAEAEARGMERGIAAIEAHFPGILYASNRTKAIAAIRAKDTP